MLSIPNDIIDLLGTANKNFRVHFPNGEWSDITNENIVKESITLTESICSEQELHFGLCETPHLDFETFGVGNVKGASIRCYLEVYCDNTVPGSVYRDDLDHYVYPIPYGEFVVDSCKKQADMTHRKFSCFSAVASYDWEIPVEVRNSLSCVCSEYSAIVDQISAEAVLAMLFPDYDRTYTREARTTRGLTGTYQYTGSDGTVYELDIYASEFSTIFEDAGTDPSISVVKEHYTDEYIAEVGRIRQMMKRLKIGDDLMRKGFNSFTKTLYGCNPNNSTYRYIGMTNGFYIPQLEDQGISKALYPTNRALVTPYIYVGTEAYTYPWWQTANAGWFEGVGSMQTYIFKFHSPLWVRVSGVELRDVTHSVVLGSAHLDAEDDYIDYEIDAINLKAGTSGVNFKIKNVKKKLSMTTSNGTAKRNVYLAVPDSINPTGVIGDPMDWHDTVEDYLALIGKFGRVNREGNFEILRLEEKLALYPSLLLYPGSTLYPSDDSGIEIEGGAYKTAWYDDEYTLPVGKVCVAYVDNTSNEDEYQEEYCPGFTEESDQSTYKVYDISGNDLIRARKWAEADITVMLDEIVSNVSNVRYMPAEIVLEGRPDVEAGDSVRISTSDGELVTLVLRRTLTGIQVLNDSYYSD